MKRSKFSLSHHRLLTMDMGKLIPVGLTEVLPGDTIQHATSALVRVSPLLSPVMHPVSVQIHHWFVPHRLVWDSWEDFITGGPDGANASVFPTREGTFMALDLGDYLGVPTGVYTVPSALPFRGYQLIWNEWYRDQDLQAEAGLVKTDGSDVNTSIVLQSVSWEKDYFTSARPWPQKGPDVTIPLGLQAPVLDDGQAPTFDYGPANGPLLNDATGTYAAVAHFAGAASAEDTAVKWANPHLYADLTNATAANINEVRRAFALQRYAEARARYGSRYTEYLRYLGVKSSDARLQRPEYLGGGRQTIQFSEVLKTGSGDDPAEPIGALKGHGIGAMRSNRYRRFFEEHGYIFSLMTVRPKSMYMNGLFRHWNRRTKEDFFQRELQHIGQQEILNKEVYAGAADPEGVFGYQDRYDEYRRTESSIHGEFRSTLDHWHYARSFATEPVLNGAFVSCDATKRVYADQTSHSLWVMVNHSMQARRLLAARGSSHIF